MFYPLTPAVRNLLIINVLVFVAGYVFKTDLGDQFGLRNPNAEGFKAYQFFTYMFLHGDLRHLFSNMFGLFMFGPMLEQVWGTQRFVFFYVFTAVGAGFLYLVVNHYEMSKIWHAVETYAAHPTPDAFLGFVNKYTFASGANFGDFLENFRAKPTDKALIDETLAFLKSIYERRLNIPMVGASGAIFGIIMAYGMLFPNQDMYIMLIPFPIKAKYFVTFYGLYELYAGVKRVPGDNIAHFAHLGGMLFAFILLYYWGSFKKR